jgi:protein TonB
LLFVIAGVISIYAYDARMEDQNLELATIMPLVELPAEPPHETPAAQQPARNNNPQNAYIRQKLVANVNEPDVKPDFISVNPNPDVPRPRQGIVIIGNTNLDPTGDGRSNSESGTGTSGTGRPSPAVVISDPPPPPAPTPKPVPKIVRKQILNGEARVLPKPPYPPLAKQAHIQGTVTVQVLIDEKGNVVSATPVSGHPFLVHAAKAAALQARFSPTMYGDQPVKVSGLITYNFLLN